MKVLASSFPLDLISIPVNPILMPRVNAKRYTTNRSKIKNCSSCNWLLKDTQSCRVVEPGIEVKIELDEKCMKFENKRGEEHSSHDELFEPYKVK